MPEELSPQELIDLIILARQVQWINQLDLYEQEALRLILSAVSRAERAILAEFEARAANISDWGEQRSLAVLDELSNLTLGLRASLAADIADVASFAGAASYLTHNNIVSFDGRVVPFNPVSLSATQLRRLAVDTPVGGHLLRDWVDRSFDRAMVSGIREEILAGRLIGERIPEMVSRLTAGFDMVERDAISLVRTYVASANVGAMEDVYRANTDVVKGVKWLATMEIGNRPGRGTCVRCAALDGQKFRWDEPRPECPLHVRCRCVLAPWTITWREMGLDIDEIAEVYRPWTRRTGAIIGSGRRGRTILEHGFHQGDFASWFSRMADRDQLNIVGPGRFSLLQSGQVSFQDLIHRATGRLRLLVRDSRGRIIGLQ